MRITKKIISLLVTLAMVLSAFSAVTVFAEDEATIEPYYVQDFDKDEYLVSNGGGTYQGYDTWQADDSDKFGAPRQSQASWDGWEIKVAVYDETGGNKFLRVGQNTTLTMKNGPFDAYFEEAAALGADSYKIRYDIKFENPDATSQANITWRTSSADHNTLQFEDGKVLYKLHHNTSGNVTGLTDSGVEYTVGDWHTIEYFYESGKVSVLFDDQIVFTGDDRYATYADSVWNDNVYYFTCYSNTAMGLDNFEISAHESHNYATNFDKIALSDNTLKIDGSVIPAGKVKLTMILTDPDTAEIYSASIDTGADGKFSDEITLEVPAETGTYTLSTVLSTIFAGTNTSTTFTVCDAEDRLAKLDFSGEDGDGVRSIVMSDLFFYDVDVSAESLYGSLADTDVVFDALAGEEFDTVADFKNAFAYAVTFQGMRETTDADTLVGILENNAEVFGLDLTGAFQDYKSEICALIINEIDTINDDADLAAYIRKAEVYYELVNTSRTKVMETVESYEEELLEYGLTEDFEDGKAKNRKNAALAILDVEFDDEDVFNLAERMEEIIEEMNEGFEKRIESGRKTSSGGSSTSVSSVSISGTPSPDTGNTPPVVVPVPPVVNNGFADVANGHWANNAITYVKNNGIMVGDNGNFRPDDGIKREEFAKIVIEAFDIAAVDGEIAFDDVDANAWYNEYIRIAFTNGLINGQNEGTFGVGKSITRQDVCVILYRYLADKTLKVNAVETVAFDDADEIADYAKDAVEYMQKYQIMVGADGKFNPNQPLTRAMAAQLIYNIMNVR